MGHDREIVVVVVDTFRTLGGVVCRVIDRDGVQRWVWVGDLVRRRG